MGTGLKYGQMEMDNFVFYCYGLNGYPPKVHVLKATGIPAGKSGR